MRFDSCGLLNSKESGHYVIQGKEKRAASSHTGLTSTRWLAVQFWHQPPAVAQTCLVQGSVLPNNATQTSDQLATNLGGSHCPLRFRNLLEWLRTQESTILRVIFSYQGYTNGGVRKGMQFLHPLLLEWGHITLPAHQCVPQPGSSTKPQYPEQWVSLGRYG